ncbi:CarboxypepD_reg-like domain-containing protein [Chitinophaga sp. CF118]|uniref:carboxypeptidase-like regulatory domain-containing protein n=1 Tax=Chitinophaga sp. CF118 TaxID=1884367 RepID=UPI0008E61441|nr:carboxypeptidase-like regulatory domain-containing protein [Chitinophaga sp. CF118]SFD86609.1 CarboxypepD_reg-like domain-containing protein [Chitinophaga sp. CF118]
MKHHLRLCLLLLFLAGNQVVAQEKFVTLSGRVTDAGNHQPVIYANIQLKNGSIGTIANAGGEFIFKIAEKFWKDSLLISCIGYKTITMSLTSGSLQDMDIRMEPSVYLLPVVSVNVRDGFGILKHMISSIPENYDTADVRLTAFYRENIRLAGDTINFNESVLDIYKTYHTSRDHKDQIHIIKGRKKKVDWSKDPQLYSWIANITNTAYSSLNEDLQKYLDAKYNILNERNFRYYTCDYKETVREGDRNLLVLYLQPKEDSRKALVHAKLYIEEATGALVRCEMETTPAGIDYVNRHQKGGIGHTIMSKIVKATLDFTKLSLVITYKKYRSKTYLSTIQRHWECVVNSKKREMKDVQWIGDFHLLVTDVNTNSLQRFATGISNDKESMNHEVGNDYDPTFWENYNILLPVLEDSLQQKKETTQPSTKAMLVSNRQNGFTQADTLRGMLSPLRSCYDVSFYHLDVDVNPDTRSIQGRNKIRFKVMVPFNLMQLDLYANMHIEKILYGDQSLSFTRKDDAVFVRFPATLPAGSEETIAVYYNGVPQVPDFNIPMHGGVLWDKDEEGNPWIQMVCQGSGASLWWPNKDHLSDEPDSMRIWITVPNGVTEISNGRLQRTTPAGTNKTRYEWLVSYPINNYNATFCIGKYAHFKDAYISSHDTLTIDYYVMPYNLERGRTMFAQVKPMLACFEQHFGKYPFPRDGFTLLESPYPMEHQSGVCIGKIKEGMRLDYTPMVWHESAHEWWGNAISCKDIADMWIHEAFATYAEALMMECSDGKAMGVAYLDEQKDHVNNKEPVTGVYNVNHIHYNIGDMYTKGSLMLNTFRFVLDNDTLWFNLLKDIQQHFRYQTLSSDELVSYICQRTRTNYTWFFEQYLKYTCLPRLEISLKEHGANLQLKYRWQADVSGFKMPVKVTVAPGRFGFIYPTTDWQMITLKQMKEDDFEVDEDHFYIQVAEA